MINGIKTSGVTNAELAEKIETLEDLRWQARDTADHLQALLDSQSDIIIRRDCSGRLTFANRAFCTKFGLQLSGSIGKPFNCRPIERDRVLSDADLRETGLPAWAEPVTEKLKTNEGLRWIEWSHRRVHDTHSNEIAIQTIGRDVTSQRLHEQALAAARDDACAADRAKSRFLASMSHEIRTPMNGIMGMTGLLIETELSPEQQTYTNAVRKSASILLSLIDEILDFSKVEAGHLELSSDPVDIVECLQSVVELLAPRAYQKNLQLAWSTAPDMPAMFRGDEARLRQILLNLIGNAVKFTEVGGISIWMGADLSADPNNHAGTDEAKYSIKVVIRDTGPGLSEQGRDRIFKEFERAVPSGATHESGTGLGLAIAQRLARSMGGGITVASREGHGSTFTLAICLPVAAPAEPPAAQITVEGRLAGRTIAIVSPDLIERRNIADFLRAHEAEVLELANPTALDVIASGSARRPPDTVLFNCNIDPAQAQAMLGKISAVGAVRGAVIAATGKRSEFERFSSAGIESFLVRPIRPETLLALLSGEVDRLAAERSNSPPSRPNPPALPDQPRSWRTLVAEDNEINALLARTILKRLGCDPVVVTDGGEAIEAVARSLTGDSSAFDAILMDLHMPSVDGFEATAEIRRLCTAAGAPTPVIIAVTANAFQEDRARCLAAGMDDYLSKPFEPGDLKRVLDGIAARRIGG